jgi:hypothetical protein
MKNSSDTIGNRASDFPACRAVPRPTAPPTACPQIMHGTCIKITVIVSFIYLCTLTLYKRRVKSHLPFASIIRSSPYSPH